ncbi:MAG: O-antigen ligase family protein [Bacteroidetes bacterium]|nr:O-antigen ligase family protein [Bacteroidota bacterium]
MLKALAKIKPDIFNLHLLFTFFLVAIIPFAFSLISYGLVLWIISGVVLMLVKRETVSKFNFNFGLVINILLYFVFVVGVFYSQNTASALFDIQVKITLLIVPPLIFLLRNFYQKHFNLTMTVFVVSNIVAGIACFLLAFYHSLHFSDGTLVFNSKVPGVFEDVNTAIPSYFSYSIFSAFKHPAYFSMYLVLCVFIMVYFYRNSLFIFKSQLKSKFLYITIISFLILIIYFLESKAAYLSLLLLFLIYSIGYVWSEKKWILGIAIILSIIVIGIIGFKQNSRFYYIKTALKSKSEFVQAIQKKDYKLLIDTYGIDRIPIWMISSEVIQENFIIGVGSGDVSDALLKKYKIYKLQSLESNKYNTHNQYLETFIAVGLIGFIIFILWLFYPLFLKRNYTKRNFLILIFIGIISINFLFETALNTISGVIFIAFFYSFLLFASNQKMAKDNS